jgi:hypothetical protein
MLVLASCPCRGFTSSAQQHQRTRLLRLPLCCLGSKLGMRDTSADTVRSKYYPAGGSSCRRVGQRVSVTMTHRKYWTEVTATTVYDTVAGCATNSYFWHTTSWYDSLCAQEYENTPTRCHGPSCHHVPRWCTPSTSSYRSVLMNRLGLLQPCGFDCSLSARRLHGRAYVVDASGVAQRISQHQSFGETRSLLPRNKQ